MTQRTKLILKILFPVFLLLLSIGIVIVGRKYELTTKTGEELVLAIVLFTAGICLELVIVLELHSAQGADATRMWEIRNRGDLPLQNIRTLFARIAEKKYSDNDLFIDYFVRQFEEIEHTIRDAAEKDELAIRKHHFASADNVLSAFSGESHPIHKYTWVVEPNEQLFQDEAGKRYFQLVDQMVRKRLIGEVQALLIVQDMTVLTDKRVAKLLDFYKTTNSFECRIILTAHYDKLKHDAGVVGDFIDFGIYGTRLMFLTKEYEPETHGVFVKNLTKVARYSGFFDQLWKTHSCRPNPSSASSKVSFDALVAFDEHPET